MSVEVNIHKTHRPFADGQATVAVEGDTIGECLDNLVARYPKMSTALFQAPGRLNSKIDIYLNMATTYPDELATKVSAGDEIHITVMLAGG